MRLKDTIVVSIPLNVTVDLGYCVERAKQKRLKKLRQWEKKHLSARSNNAEDSKTKMPNHDSDLENSKYKFVAGLKDDSINKSSEASSKEVVSDDVHISEEEDAPPLSSNTLRREQFGGIIDYLEAKYVRGVVLEDPDEKIRRRERHKKRKLKLMQQKNAAKRSKIEEGEAGTTTSDAVKDDREKEEEKSLTEEEDLDYSTADDARSIYSEDSFLDDSLLIKGVAEQVQASSAYGGVTKVESEARKIKVKADDASNHEGILADNDDAGFFVNVGDLEMDEEYVPVVDWHLPEKNKLKSMKKRKYNLEVSRDAQATAKEKKKTPKKVPLEKKPDASNEDVTKEAPSSSQASQKKKKSSENQKELVKLREQAKELHREHRRLFDLVVKEISEMTEEQMPRKGLMENIKVTLSVPEGKNPGDSLMFNNPRDPNQRLKVTIPSNAIPGGSFMVSLPVPKVVITDMEENNFSKGAREALHDYSKAYDTWAEVDWKIKELLGETKDLTLHKEKMKKFDELVTKFPDDLEIPVDIPFLRKVVRRVTQNFKKRKENIDRVDATSPTMKLASVKMEEVDDGLAIQDSNPNIPSNIITLHLPKKSTNFALISFNSADFK